MADEAGADQVVAETTEAANAPEVDTEARAHRMGWRPKEQYKGPEGDWIPAEQFIERVTENFPLLKRTLKVMEERGAKTEKELEGLKESLDHMRDFAAKGEERGYKKARQELEAQRVVAIQHADVDTVRAVEAQIKELDDTAKPAAPKPKPADDAGAGPKPVPEIVDWVKENPWFNTDKQLARVAKAIDEDFLEMRPGLSIRDRLAAVKDEIQRRYPEKFSNPRREAPSSVANSNGAPARKKNGRSYDDLPPEAKKACDKIVGQFKGHKKPFTRDEYVANYEWGDA